MTRGARRWTTALALSLTFGTGYLCGSVGQRAADAQVDVKGLGGAVMEKAGDSGGAVGTAAKLGTAVSDMQTHVTALQKNLETLKTLQSALGR